MVRRRAGSGRAYSRAQSGDVCSSCFVRSPFLLVGGGTPVLASLLNSYGRMLVEAASTMTAAELHNSWLTYFRGVFC